ARNPAGTGEPVGAALAGGVALADGVVPAAAGDRFGFPPEVQAPSRASAQTEPAPASTARRSYGCAGMAAPRLVETTSAQSSPDRRTRFPLRPRRCTRRPP